MKTLRITARVLSTIYGALLLFMMIGEIAFPHVDPSAEASIEGYFVGGVSLLILISIIVAWFKVKAGGIMLIISSISMATLIALTAGQNQI